MPRGIMPEAGFADLALIVSKILPGARVEEVTPLAPDSGKATQTAKTVGYGAPLKIRVTTAAAEQRMLVLHTATANAFGHDRRADRASAMLLAYDTFASIPKHAPALDVGAVTKDGRALISLRDTAEFYLLTEWAEGHVYADELRALAQRGAASPTDLQHCRTLALYLSELHEKTIDYPAGYARAVRDLLGSGEGIFGIIDGYTEDVPAAPSSRLRSIEQLCWDWRWRIREQHSRLCRTHGDFHPFNILFDDRSTLTLLDASRGSIGDPADDVACLAINYVFFALAEPGLWSSAFRQLWYEFWRVYDEARQDRGLYDVVAPYLAWRGLVLANPVWYASVTGEGRDRLLGFVEAALSAQRFSPDMAEAVFA